MAGPTNWYSAVACGSAPIPSSVDWFGQERAVPTGRSSETRVRRAAPDAGVGRAGARQKWVWGAQGALKVRAASFDLECVRNEYCRTIVIKVTKQLESTALARGKGFSESTAFRAPVRISGATAGESYF